MERERVETPPAARAALEQALRSGVSECGVDRGSIFLGLSLRAPASIRANEPDAIGRRVILPGFRQARADVHLGSRRGAVRLVPAALEFVDIGEGLGQEFVATNHGTTLPCWYTPGTHPNARSWVREGKREGCEPRSRGRCSGGRGAPLRPGRVARCRPPHGVPALLPAVVGRMSADYVLGRVWGVETCEQVFDHHPVPPDSHLYVLTQTRSAG